MKLYHTFQSENGFDLNRINFDRGIFAVKPWWVGKPQYREYSEFHPNEFGDKVVEIDIDDNVKTFEAGDQIEILENLFGGSPETKRIIDKYERGIFEQSDWQKLDEFIGKFLKKKGYKLIHYSEDQMYGDVWTILDKSIINGYRFEDETKLRREDMQQKIDEEHFEPDENDCFITDVVRGGYDVSCDGKFLSHFIEYDEAVDAIIEWQDENNYFPNTWFIDDHGGYALVNLHDKLAYEGFNNVKLKQLVPKIKEQEISQSPIDGMRKQQAVKYIQKNFKVYEKLKGFFSDESWQPINSIIGELQKGGIPIEINKTEYYKDTNGNPAGKIWQCEIPFINQNNRQDKIYVRITAAGAGSVSDPLSRYDVTFVIN